jgi:hypothetical protein
LSNISARCAMTTEPLSDRLERLAKDATPGDWHTADLDQGMQIWSSVHQYIGATRDYTRNDAVLIVELRNALPIIITALRKDGK